MRVALFFDGKNFYSGWKTAVGGEHLDFVKLSRWLVERVGGSLLSGAYYYTGVEADAPLESNKLVPFLDALERRPGFFVKRFPRQKRSTHCASCAAEIHYTEEKEVDTTIVADMLRLAAVGAFDVAVLLSGDADLAPAVEGVRTLGRQAYVATWGGLGLSARLRKAAFDHIDLSTGLAQFELNPAALLPSSSRSETTSSAPRPTAQPDVGAGNSDRDEEAETIFLDELASAEQQFTTGYVGANYFVTKWRSERLDSSPIVRRRILARLENAGRLVIYDTDGGDQAIRRK